jgi:hypothetical protein
MDYLHGDVADSELKAACLYEYGRESSVLCEASQQLEQLAIELLAKKEEEEPQVFEVFDLVESTFSCGQWFCEWPWLALWWVSTSFPSKAWTQLKPEERQELRNFLPLQSNNVKPIQLLDVFFLGHIYKRFGEMIETAKTEFRQSFATDKKRPKTYPVFTSKDKSNPTVHVLMPLDFSKTKTHLLEQIKKWLERPENSTLFETHRPRTEEGTEKEARDRLKDLAAWRLRRELGGSNKALEFAEQNRKRDKKGNPRPFHDPRQGQSKKMPVNESPLYSYDSGETPFANAKRRALQHRARLIPWEFGKYAEEIKQGEEESHRALLASIKDSQFSTNDS